MLQPLLWYLLISILGLLTLPLTYRLLPALADRGYAFSRTLGLLLWGFVFWLLASLGILRNDNGGQLLALILLLSLSAWILRNIGWSHFREWLRTQRRAVLTVEIVFLAAFWIMVVVRGTNPEIIGTEKPMELAFINAIIRSPTMPPNDPWLSGYAISYYYFGYVLVAMFAQLTGTSAGVAFNLGISLVFALSAIGSYGVLYNLLSNRKVKSKKRSEGYTSKKNPLPTFPALLGPFFILLVSNLEGFLHVLHINRLFWSDDGTGQLTSRFWKWLGIKTLNQPPGPEPFPHWWWWRASRVVQDYDFLGKNKGDIIDEFPVFSFILSDLHPHVLAMPFAFLAIALALNLFLGGGRGHMNWLRLRLNINAETFAISAITLGGLSFLNTWDFPFYLALFAGAYILYRAKESGWGWERLKDFITIGFTLGVSGVLLYLPFFLSFSSQAGGPLPNLIYITRGTHFWIMFAPLLVPVLLFLFYLWRSCGDVHRLKQSLKVNLGLVFALMLFTLLLALVISILPRLQSINPDAGLAEDAFLGTVAAPSWGPLIREGFNRRLTIPGTLLTLFVLLTFVVALFWPRKNEVNQSHSPLIPPHTFTLLLTLIGALLALAPEFVWLRDMFGYRINTIFKFYFQIWLLWGIAAAYTTVVLWDSLRGGWGIIYRVGMLALMGMSLTYTVLGFWTKTNGFNPPQGWALDGTAHRMLGAPDEVAASLWLLDAPMGVVAEAVGGPYSSAARMASHSGMPTVLGWENHEEQWRGGTEELGSRRGDIERLYCTPDWDAAKMVLDQYDIRYVTVGNLERSTYAANESSCPNGLNEGKFIRYLDIVFQQGSVTIFEVPAGVSGAP